MSGARKLLWSGIALTGLLALVAVASRAHRPGGGSGIERAHSSTLIGDYLATLALIIVPLGAILILWGLTQRRRQGLGQPYKMRHALLRLVLAALLLGGAVWVATTLRRGHGSAAPRVPTLPTPATGGSAAHRSAPFYRAHFRWLPVLVLGSIVVGLGVTTAVGVARRRRHGAELDEQAALAAALDEVLADTLDDLRAERDPRRAVIRAYARMERTFAAYGVPREPSEAPLEYLARVLDSIQVSAYSVRRLTQLFERAKFSPHEIDSSMKDDAIEALAGLRAELEDRRAAA